MDRMAVMRFVARFCALVFAFGVLAIMPARAADPLTPDQVQQIEKVIRDYLLRHPEVLVEAMQSLEAQQKLAEAEQNRARIGANRKALLEDPDSFVVGNPKGDVTVVEFFDYRCPYCKQVHPVVRDAVAKDGKVRLVLKEFPILGPDSLTASRAAVAALQQKNKYLAFHDALMGLRGGLSEATILQTAKEAGLDTDKLKADMKDPRVDRILRANHALAETLAITGTPAFVVGDELVSGALPPERLRELIQKARTGCVTC